MQGRVFKRTQGLRLYYLSEWTDKGFDR
jgi:hypothetical protein